MTFRKILTAAVAAAVLSSASASAAPQATVATPSTPTPWVGIVLSASVVSVILNGAIVSATQCRELTAQEAHASILLPFLGLALNSKASACGKKKKKKK